MSCLLSGCQHVCDSFAKCVCKAKTWFLEDMNPWRMSTLEVVFALTTIATAVGVNLYFIQQNFRRYEDASANPSSSLSYVTLQSLPPLIFQICGGPFVWVTYQYNSSSVTPGITPNADLNQYCIQIVQDPTQNFELPIKGANDTVENNKIIIIQGQLPAPYRTLFVTVAANTDLNSVPILPIPDGASARVSTLGLNSDSLDTLLGLSVTTFRDVHSVETYETELSKDPIAPSVGGRFVLIMTTKDVNFNGLQVTQSLAYSLADVFLATWVGISISLTVFAFVFPRLPVVRSVRVFRCGS